jgi:hypothetical protein
MKPINGGDFWFLHPNVPVYAFDFKRRNVKVRFGIEFLELELNSNSIYKYRGKKLCLGAEF